MKVFYSKMDSFFIKLVAVIILLLGVLALLPLVFVKNPDLSFVVILIVFFSMMVGFILWTLLSIKYCFYDNHLFIKGGPFRSRIVYDDISKISPTKEVFGGYTVLSARNSIEIFYSKSLLGSVKISPYEQKAFLVELKKRCPNLNNM